MEELKNQQKEFKAKYIEMLKRLQNDKKSPRKSLEFENVGIKITKDVNGDIFFSKESCCDDVDDYYGHYPAELVKYLIQFLSK